MLFRSAAAAPAARTPTTQQQQARGAGVGSAPAALDSICGSSGGGGGGGGDVDVTVPTAKERLSWLMRRVATRVAAMDKHFMVLDLAVACSLCRRGDGGHAAMAAPEHWACMNRSCDYTLCASCITACGGTPNRSSRTVPSTPQHGSPRLNLVLLPASSRPPLGFRACRSDHHNNQHRFVHEALPPGHFTLQIGRAHV